MARPKKNAEPTLTCCPHCGSDWGVYVKYTGRQHYDWTGEPAGYHPEDADEDQTQFVRCLKCDRKISMKRFLAGKDVDWLPC